MPPGTSMRAIGALLVVGAVVACARPPASRVPASAEPAADEPTPTRDVVDEPAADEPAAPSDPAPPAVDPAASVGDERRLTATGPRFFIEPPSPAASHNDADVWGGDGAAEFGRGGLGCPRSASKPPPSYERQGRRSLVRLHSLAAVGPLTRAQAQGILVVRATGIRDCHAAAMEPDPTLAGELRLRLEIDESGRVTAAEAEAPELGGVAACALALARGWRFPPAGRGSKITVSYALSTEVAPSAELRGPTCRR